MLYHIDYFKNRDLSSRERDQMRKNQKGLWIYSGKSYQAPSAWTAVALAFRDPEKVEAIATFRVRARLDKPDEAPWFVTRPKGGSSK